MPDDSGSKRLKEVFTRTAVGFFMNVNHMANFTVWKFGVIFAFVALPCIF